MGFVGFVTCTMFLRTRIHPTDMADGELYLACLFFGLVHMLFNGFSELPLMIFRLPVFYKQRDNLFYPAWAWSISSFILRVPYSMIESIVWSCIVYYSVGFAPGAGRFFLAINLSFWCQCLPIITTSLLPWMLQVFPFHAVTLRSTPNGTGTLPDDGFCCKRYDYCKYFWCSSIINNVSLGWIYIAKA